METEIDFILFTMLISHSGITPSFIHVVLLHALNPWLIGLLVEQTSATCFALMVLGSLL